MLVGGWLILINSVLTRLAMFMLSFFEVPKGYLKNWITIGQGFFFGNLTNIRRNIDYPNGVFYASQKKLAG